MSCLSYLPRFDRPNYRLQKRSLVNYEGHYVIYFALLLLHPPVLSSAALCPQLS
jgi:hypothetical protein